MAKDVVKLLAIEEMGETVIIVPQADLSEFAFMQLESEAAEVLALLDRARPRHMIVDCHKSTYFGSSALGFFMKFWLRVRRGGGRMAFCNMSDTEKEILHITKADSLWALCSTRAEALAAVRSA